MSKVTSFLSRLLSAAKAALNALLGTQKSKAKAFVHDKADEFYNNLDHVTEVATISALEDYLQSKVGDSNLGAAIVAGLGQLIALGIATGVVEMGLKTTDALTKQEIDKLVAYIDKRIDGARF